MNKLRNAKKPLLIIGAQVAQCHDNLEETVAAINKLGIPCYLSGMSRGMLGKKNKILFKHERRVAFKEADLVILAGVPLDFRLNYGLSIPQKTFVVSCNKDKVDLYKNRTPNLPIHADCSVFLTQLAAQDIECDWNSWVDHLRELNDTKDTSIAAQANESSELCNPVRLCSQLNTLMDENSILVADGGDFIGTAAYTVHPTKPFGWLDPGPFGTLGVGAGFALAAKLAYPESEVWLLYGDGACGFSLMEYDTFVRHNVPVIGLIGNDACWQQIKRDQVRYFKGEDVGCELQLSNYEKVAASLGGEGFLIDKNEQIESLINKAKEVAKNGTPCLINALVSKTDFRKGSLSM